MARWFPQRAPSPGLLAGLVATATSLIHGHFREGYTGHVPSFSASKNLGLPFLAAITLLPDELTCHGTGRISHYSRFQNLLQPAQI